MDGGNKQVQTDDGQRASGSSWWLVVFRFLIDSQTVQGLLNDVTWSRRTPSQQKLGKQFDNILSEVFEILYGSTVHRSTPTFTTSTAKQMKMKIKHAASNLLWGSVRSVTRAIRK